MREFLNCLPSKKCVKMMRIRVKILPKFGTDGFLKRASGKNWKWEILGALVPRARVFMCFSGYCRFFARDFQVLCTFMHFCEYYKFCITSSLTILAGWTHKIYRKLLRTCKTCIPNVWANDSRLSEMKFLLRIWNFIVFYLITLM